MSYHRISGQGVRLSCMIIIAATIGCHGDSAPTEDPLRGEEVDAWKISVTPLDAFKTVELVEGEHREEALALLRMLLRKHRLQEEGYVPFQRKWHVLNDADIMYTRDSHEWPRYGLHVYDGMHPKMLEILRYERDIEDPLHLHVTPVEAGIRVNLKGETQKQLYSFFSKVAANEKE